MFKHLAHRRRKCPIRMGLVVRRPNKTRYRPLGSVRSPSWPMLYHLLCVYNIFVSSRRANFASCKQSPIRWDQNGIQTKLKEPTNGFWPQQIHSLCPSGSVHVTYIVVTYYIIDVPWHRMMCSDCPECFRFGGETECWPKYAGKWMCECQTTRGYLKRRKKNFALWDQWYILRCPVQGVDTDRFFCSCTATKQI